MMLKKNKTLFFWTKTILLVTLFLYFVVLNILQPTGNIKFTWHYGIWFPITSYVVLWEGRLYFKIYKQMLRGSLSMDTLVGLGAHILYIYSIVMFATHIKSPMFAYDAMWEGSGILILFTNIGHHIQEKISSSSLETYNKLNDMKNQFVNIYKNGTLKTTRVSEVKIGEVILIKRGEFVALDGIALTNGSLDYSNITGEAKAVFKKIGEPILSGSYNVGDNIKLEVSKTSEDSTISRIIDSIEKVSSNRPPMQQLADKILKYFIPAVLSIAFITFIIWLSLGLTSNINVPWIKKQGAWEMAVKAMVTVIAIACPCALGIATPLVYTVSSMLAAKRGILINNPKSLEEINKIKIVAFDKTGTITSSEMRVAKIWGESRFLEIAAGLEKEIDHPIANAISRYSKAKEIKDIKYVKNTGVSGLFNNKKYVIKRYEGKEFPTNKLNTNIALYEDKKPILVYELENKIKNEVKNTIEQLHKMKIKTVMITGDDQEVAENIAKKVGISKVYANVSPIEKANIIKTLQLEDKTAFVGDGFNDAIAIKQANVSFAFSQGSDISNSLSDISFFADNFSEILSFFKLGRLNATRVRLSLTYAFGFNIIVIPIAFLLLVQPWVGAAIMAVSDILVALNALVYKINGERKMKYHNDRGKNDTRKNARNSSFRK